MAAGQNKNQTVFSSLAQMQWSGTYDVINHKYLVRGHTLRENDHNFSQIEKRKQGVVVLLPMDWCTIIVWETNLRKPLRFVQTKDDFFSKINSHLWQKELLFCSSEDSNPRRRQSDGLNLTMDSSSVMGMVVMEKMECLLMKWVVALWRWSELKDVL